MRWSGASISGDELVLVTVVKEDSGFRIEFDASLKQKLHGTTDQQAVKAFFTAISGFVRNNNIDRIALRGRFASGMYAGGATTYKIEGLLQILDNCSVTILMPPTIAAKHKRFNFVPPASAFKYQIEAFHAACSALMG